MAPVCNECHRETIGSGEGKARSGAEQRARRRAVGDARPCRRQVRGLLPLPKFHFLHESPLTWCSNPTLTDGVLLNFSRVCSPQSMSEHLDNRNVVFLKVDVDEVQELAALCGIKCMPTFQFYRHGKKIDEFVGSNKDKLQEMVEKHK
uniref:Thioredoxin domain-containing protein n=1 Tax=Scleropages formosus TaxID=113540 RepID=A0A8C9SJU3_SCLFO